MSYANIDKMPITSIVEDTTIEPTSDLLVDTERIYVEYEASRARGETATSAKDLFKRVAETKNFNEVNLKAFIKKEQNDNRETALAKVAQAYIEQKIHSLDTVTEGTNVSVQGVKQWVAEHEDELFIQYAYPPVKDLDEVVKDFIELTKDVPWETARRKYWKVVNSVILLSQSNAVGEGSDIGVELWGHKFYALNDLLSEVRLEKFNSQPEDIQKSKVQKFDSVRATLIRRGGEAYTCSVESKILDIRETQYREGWLALAKGDLDSEFVGQFKSLVNFIGVTAGNVSDTPKEPILKTLYGNGSGYKELVDLIVKEKILTPDQAAALATEIFDIWGIAVPRL